MLTFTGTVKGVKTINKENKANGEVWQEHYVGISTPKVNGYKGEEIIRDIKITQNQMQNSMMSYYEGLVGKRVNVEVFITNRAYNNIVYSDWFLGGEGRPISIDGKPAAAVKAV